MTVNNTSEISEPILSFVETVKSEPSRFELEVKDEVFDGQTGILYDKESFLYFRFKIFGNVFLESVCVLEGEYKTVVESDWKDLSWVTTREWHYLTNELLKPIYVKNKIRKRKIEEKKRELGSKRKRKEFMNIYCKEKL